MAACATRASKVKGAEDAASEAENDGVEAISISPLSMINVMATDASFVNLVLPVTFKPAPPWFKPKLASQWPTPASLWSKPALPWLALAPPWP